MEVVISKVEELKVLIDSATDRVKASSVHCLQELLHHLVAFYSTQRFFYFSLVVVDTKTGKEQRFYTFRDLLDHSKYLLSQTEQSKNAQQSQYLERALANDVAGPIDKRKHLQGSSQRNQKNQELTSNHGRQAAHPQSSDRPISAQQQYSVAGPQIGVGFSNVSRTDVECTQRVAIDARHSSPRLVHPRKERVNACLAKDGSNVTHESPVGPESSVASVAVTAYSCLNQFTNCTNGGPQLHHQTSNHQMTRNSQLITRSSQPNFTDCQPRRVVGLHVPDGQQMSYNGSVAQSAGRNFCNNISEGRETAAVNTVLTSFNTCVAIEGVCNQNHKHSTSVAYSSLLGDKPQADSSPGPRRSLRELIDDVDSCDPHSWSPAQTSTQVPANSVSSVASHPSGELSTSFASTSMLMGCSDTLDLTAAPKGTSDVSAVPELVARRSLSRMTNTPMVKVPQLPQGGPVASDISYSATPSVRWPSCRKESSGLLQNHEEIGTANLFSSHIGSVQVENHPLQNKDQNGNALIAKNSTVGDLAPSAISVSSATTLREFSSGTLSMEDSFSDAPSSMQSMGKCSSARLSRSTRRTASISRRKSSSPQKIVAHEGQTPATPSEPLVENSDDGDPSVEVIDSEEDENGSKESPNMQKKIRKTSDARIRYYCFYCNDTDHRVTLNELLLHLKEFHLKVSGDKSGLACPQCGKIYKHKTEGTDGMYSTLLACLNHVMCQHSSPVPDYMTVYKCGQCSFVSLIKTIVKRHEQCHSSQDADAKCDDCGKQVKKQSQRGHRAHCLALTETSSKDEHQCGSCKKKYSSKSALAIHIERKHKNVNSFLCYMCPSSFYAKVDLERHMYAQHSVNISRRAVIKCPICDYQSLEGSLMRKHIKNHQVGTFVCDICGKEFGTENRLKSHRLIHTAERKYKCDDCDYSTAKRYHFERHVAVRHKGQFWKCSACSMLTFNKSNLQKHISKAHEGDAEMEEVSSVKETSGEKTSKSPKKRASEDSIKDKQSSDHQNLPESSAPLFSSTLGVDSGMLTPGANLTNFQHSIQKDSDKLDSLGIALDQQSPGLLAVKSQTLLWQLH